MGHASLAGDLAKVHQLNEQVAQYEEALIDLVLLLKDAAGVPRRIEDAVRQAVMYLDEWNPPDPIVEQRYWDFIANGDKPAKPWFMVRGS